MLVICGIDNHFTSALFRLEHATKFSENALAFFNDFKSVHTYQNDTYVIF